LTKLKTVQHYIGCTTYSELYSFTGEYHRQKSRFGDEILKGLAMRQNVISPGSAGEIVNYFNGSAEFSQQDTLGQIVLEILSEGKNINRKALCGALLARIENAATEDEGRHYQKLIGLLL